MSKYFKKYFENFYKPMKLKIEYESTNVNYKKQLYLFIVNMELI